MNALQARVAIFMSVTKAYIATHIGLLGNKCKRKKLTKIRHDSSKAHNLTSPRNFDSFPCLNIREAESYSVRKENFPTF